MRNKFVGAVSDTDPGLRIASFLFLTLEGRKSGEECIVGAVSDYLT